MVVLKGTPTGLSFFGDGVPYQRDIPLDKDLN